MPATGWAVNCRRVHRRQCVPFSSQPERHVLCHTPPECRNFRAGAAVRAFSVAGVGCKGRSARPYRVRRAGRQTWPVLPRTEFTSFAGCRAWSMSWACARRFRCSSLAGWNGHQCCLADVVGDEGPSLPVVFRKVVHDNHGPALRDRLRPARRRWGCPDTAMLGDSIRFSRMVL